MLRHILQSMRVSNGTYSYLSRDIDILRNLYIKVSNCEINRVIERICATSQILRKQIIIRFIAH